MKKPLCSKIPALAALSFGIGVLLSFFLPPAVMIVLLALVIVGAGLLSILQL